MQETTITPIWLCSSSSLIDVCVCVRVALDPPTLNTTSFLHIHSTSPHLSHCVFSFFVSCFVSNHTIFIVLVVSPFRFHSWPLLHSVIVAHFFFSAPEDHVSFSRILGCLPTILCLRPLLFLLLLFYSLRCRHQPFATICESPSPSSSHRLTQHQHFLKLPLTGSQAHSGTAKQFATSIDPLTLRLRFGKVL